MKLIINITKGKPTKEQFEEIISMILEGYIEGVGVPYGIYWTRETEGKGSYDWLHSIIEEE